MRTKEEEDQTNKLLLGIELKTAHKYASSS